MMKAKGLALIVVIGILGVLAVLAAAFVLMAQLERRASAQRVNAARAYLLARSGIEDALARLELGQDPAYGGENWDGDAAGQLSTFEAAQEVYHRGVLDTDACPVRHAMRPSFFARVPGAGNPALLAADGRQRGYSGLLSGDYAAVGNTYALKVRSGNAGIHVNGGALDALDRDPDGPGGPPETAPLLPDTVPDHRDVSMQGPNGFLVRLLNNLDAVVTDGTSADLGVQIVGARPMGGFKSLDELKPILGQARFDRFKPYLTLHAWVDTKVVKPQPMDGRPQRWEDIDDAHRTGKEAEEIAGVRTEGGGNVQLGTPRTGSGIESDPWVQKIAFTNAYEGTRDYPVSWERDFVYAWSQLRPAPPAFEPRAPLPMNAAPRELLAAAFLGLRGTHLEVWEGSAGWDGGFGWASVQVTAPEVDPPGGHGDEAAHPAEAPGGGSPGARVQTPPQGTYAYSSQATEETPWHRTRVDYGMTYGTAGRPWYGPGSYAPHAPPRYGGGKPLVQAAPLGRLKESTPITSGQAQAIVAQILKRRAEAGLFGTWAQFNAFVDALPRWEDLDDNGVLDGDPYLVTGSGGVYPRRMYKREDRNSDGLMNREVFVPLLPPPAGWGSGIILWKDLGPTGAAPGPGEVPGLTFVQKDVLRAMANPNTDLNDFNPDQNLFKEVDKTDLAGVPSAPGSYVHTTELSLDDAAGYVRVSAEGRVLGGSGRLLARRGLGVLVEFGKLYRDSTQADFMGDQRSLAEHFVPSYAPPAPSPAPYPLAGGQSLVSYPEPQTLDTGQPRPGVYDGQIALGFIGTKPGPPNEAIRGDLFDTADAMASGDTAVTDLRGPFRSPVLASAGTGNVFPDGIYSEKDRALLYPMAGNIGTGTGALFYVAFWVKPAWFPEASPRPHALISFSRNTSDDRRYAVPSGQVPVDDIDVVPNGLYFVPARNNLWQDAMGVYLHSWASARGMGWPCRALLWGSPHTLFASDALNRRGLDAPLTTRPLGRLEAHRWQHLAAIGDKGQLGGTTKLLVGRTLTSGGGHVGAGFQGKADSHADNTPNHLRFGEIAAEHNMNYAADATFANVQAGASSLQPVAAYVGFFLTSASPAALGRHVKEDGAAYVSAPLPPGTRLLRATWTEIPCDLWFDEDADGWLGDAAGLYKPRNDRFGLSAAGLPVPLPNGLRDVRIALEVWDDLGTESKSDDVKLARFDDPAAVNHIPLSKGRIFYKAVFVNEWDPATRANSPLDVTPFLDDVTVSFMDVSGPQVVAWEEGDD